MTTKLTLTLDDKVIQKAKLYAKTNGRSLSELVESFCRAICISQGYRHEEYKGLPA